MDNKEYIFPIILTCLILVIIIYLFMNVKQPYIECNRSSTDEFGVKISEDLNVTLDGNKIDQMTLVKSIILPEKYLQDDTYLDSIQYALKESYAYLGKSDFKVSKSEDRVIARVQISDDETIILNNIDFISSDLKIKINPNTKSSDVVALKIGDQYTEGELMKRMSNNGYSCK